LYPYDDAIQVEEAASVELRQSMSMSFQIVESNQNGDQSASP